MSNTALSVANVSKTYADHGVDVRALRAVSLELERGAFAALAGPSGSGKTTLLNIIGGLDVADTGDVQLADQTITGRPQSELSRIRLHSIGFIFQSYNLIPVLTARENVEFVMLLQGVPADERRAKAEATLTEVGLEDYINTRPDKMSGGQQQRVAVARAIVSNPDIVLADEPTANLDSHTGAALLDIMRALNREHRITFLFSTHDAMVMDRADRVIHLRDGQIDSIETHAG